MPSSSGSEGDDFFIKRPLHVPSPTAPPPKRRRQVPSSDRSREGQSGSGGALPSSELEVLPAGRAGVERTGQAEAGSSRKARGGVLGAPRPLGTRSKPRIELNISSSPDQSRSPSPADQPSSTQLDRGSDRLRDMAVEKGWEGPARRPLTRPKPVAQEPAREAAVGGGVASGSRLGVPGRAGSSTDTDGSKAPSTSSGRASRTTSSTSRSSHSKEPPPRRKPPAAVVILSSPNQAQVQDDPLPPAHRPPPPPDFWNAGDVGPAKKKEKRVHGEALRKLATLSELGKKVGDRVMMDEDDDEIVEGSGSDGSDKGKGKGYESVADANKRKREEAKVRLQESRLKKQLAQPAQDTPPPAPRQGIFAMASAKGKNMSSNESCALCNKLFPAAELASHAESCFAQQAAAQPAVAAPLRAKAPPVHQAKKPPPPPVAKKPPPPRPESPTAAEVQNAALRADLNFSSPGGPRYDARAKGKGRAIESSDEEEPLAQADDEDEEEFGDEVWENYADFDDFASTRRGEVIDVGSDDDDVPLAARTYGQRRNGLQTGSSPPKGSIFISTMPPAIRNGYEQMYAVKPQKDAGGGKEGSLAPQKMSAPAKKAFKPRRGGFPRRGGGRRGGKKR